MGLCLFRETLPTLLGVKSIGYVANEVNGEQTIEDYKQLGYQHSTTTIRDV